MTWCESTAFGEPRFEKGNPDLIVYPKLLGSLTLQGPVIECVAIVTGSDFVLPVHYNPPPKFGHCSRGGSKSKFKFSWWKEI